MSLAMSVVDVARPKRVKVTKDPIPVRWHFLTDEEKGRIETYNRDMVRLISQRSYKRNDVLESKITKFRHQMDIFIMDLHDKYAAP